MLVFPLFYIFISLLTFSKPIFEHFSLFELISYISTSNMYFHFIPGCKQTFSPVTWPRQTWNYQQDKTRQGKATLGSEYCMHENSKITTVKPICTILFEFLFTNSKNTTQFCINFIFSNQIVVLFCYLCFFV